MRSVVSRIWARALLSPTSHRIGCTKVESLIPWGRGHVQLWGERSGPAHGTTDDSLDLVVLRFLGARGRAELATSDPANRLPELRSITWTFNPPSFGGTCGPLTLDNYFQAALRAFDAVTERHPAVPVWLYGKSIGATCAFHVASQRAPAALILKNIVDVRAAVARRTGGWFARAVPRHLEPRLSAAAVSAPMLFVVSREDDLALPASQEALARSCSGHTTILHVHGAHDQPALAAEDEPRYASAVQALWSERLTHGAATRRDAAAS